MAGCQKPAEPRAPAPRPQIARDAGWQLTAAKRDAWLQWMRMTTTSVDSGTSIESRGARSRREETELVRVGLTWDEAARIEEAVLSTVAAQELDDLEGTDAGVNLAKARLRFGDLSVQVVLDAKEAVDDAWTRLVETH